MSAPLLASCKMLPPGRNDPEFAPHFKRREQEPSCREEEKRKKKTQTKRDFKQKEPRPMRALNHIYGEEITHDPQLNYNITKPSSVMLDLYFVPPLLDSIDSKIWFRRPQLPPSFENPFVLGPKCTALGFPEVFGGVAAVHCPQLLIGLCVNYISANYIVKSLV